MAISMSELLQGADLSKQSKDIQENLKILLDRINKIRSLYGKSMTISSGLRTMENHLRIYEEKAKKAGIPFDKSKVPMQSKHLYGLAVDIFDPKKELQEWCKNHEKELIAIGIWLESFDDTPNWVHFQVVPYGSWKPGKSIWFKP